MTQIAPASATLVVGTHPLLVAPSNDCLRADVSFIFHTLCIPTAYYAAENDDDDAFATTLR